MNSDFRVGTWLIQPSLNTISQNGRSNRLEPKVMAVLVCLAEHTGEVVSKEKLLQTIWPDTFVSDDVLKRSWLHKAVVKRNWCIIYLKADPVWDPLRSDPRFKDLVRRVGLPAATLEKLAK